MTTPSARSVKQAEEIAGFIGPRQRTPENVTRIALALDQREAEARAEERERCAKELHDFPCDDRIGAYWLLRAEIAIGGGSA